MNKPRVSDEELERLKSVTRGLEERDDWFTSLLLDLHDAREELKQAVERIEAAFGTKAFGGTGWWSELKKKYGWTDEST